MARGQRSADACFKRSPRVEKTSPVTGGRAAFSPRHARNFKATIIVQYFPFALCAVFAVLLKSMDSLVSSRAHSLEYIILVFFAFNLFFTPRNIAHHQPREFICESWDLRLKPRRLELDVDTAMRVLERGGFVCHRESSYAMVSPLQWRTVM